MDSNILDFFKILDNKSKTKFFFLVFLLLIQAFFEVLSISLVIPLTMLLVDSAKIEIIKESIPIIQINDPKNLLLLILSLFFLVFFIKFVFSILISVYKNKFIFSLRAKFQQYLFGSYLSQPYAVFIKHKTSNLINNCISTMDDFTQNGMLGLIELLVELFLITFILFFLIFYEPLGSFFVIFIGAFFLFFYSFYTKKRISKLGNDSYESNSRLIKIANDGFKGIKELFIYKKTEPFKFSFKQSSDRLTKSQYVHQTFLDLPRIILEFIAVTVFIILLFFFVFILEYKENLIISLALFATACYKILPSLNRISVALSKVRYSIPLFDRIRNELLKSDEINKKYSKTISKNTQSYFQSLEFKNIEFSFGSKNILKEINFKIFKNEVVGITGESGSGKSTLVNIISGLYQSSSGKILWNNNEELSYENFKIGYMPQYNFMLDATIKENILFYDKNFDQDTYLNSIKFASISNLVNSLTNKDESQIGELGSKLSGGQLQRLVLARTLYKNSELIILDEVTSSIDEENQNKIMESIKLLSKSRTFIIISHQENILRKCDKVFNIKNQSMIVNKQDN